MYFCGFTPNLAPPGQLERKFALMRMETLFCTMEFRTPHDSDLMKEFWKAYYSTTRDTLVYTDWHSIIDWPACSINELRYLGTPMKETLDVDA